MARTIAEAKMIANRVVAFVHKKFPVTAAYLFGSYVTGTPHEESDIDIAIFADGVESMNVDERITFIASLQKEIAADIELHLFPSSYLKEQRPSNFIGYLISKGECLAA